MRSFFAIAVASVTQIPLVHPYGLQLLPEMYNGSVSVEVSSVAGNLDGAKMRTTSNSSSFDYWWFDMVSTMDSAAVNVVFYNAGDIGLDKPLSVEISGTFSNGTTFWNHVIETRGAFLSNDPDGIKAQWEGVGAGFDGSNLEKPNVEYKVKLDSPQLGVHGNITLKAVGQFHCTSRASANTNPPSLACTCSLSL